MTDKEERLNSISHLAGATAALAGLVVLVVLASQRGNPWKIVSFSIYGATLVSLFTFSTLYHSRKGKVKQVFRQLDHLSIYLLIAGTYTPFALVTLRGGWGWSIFGVVWGLAVMGMIVDSLPQKGRRVLPIIIYLLMGWLALIALKPLLGALPTAGFVSLLTGGVLYTVGVVFYVLDQRIRYFHAVWHLFVLGGAITHYFTVLRYIA